MTSLPDINKLDELFWRLSCRGGTAGMELAEAKTALNQLLIEARATAYEDCGSKGGSGTVVRAYAKSRAYGLRQKTDDKTYSETWTKETWTRD